MNRIGIFGGAFDPPHTGHLVIAEHVREDLKLDTIWFMPTYISPHKESSHIHATSRLEMLELALASNPYFRMNDVEVKRKGKSYSIDTIRELKAAYPNAYFYFIIGADMVDALPSWHQIDELIKLVTFVGVNRSGYELTSTYSFKEVQAPLIDISSTMIRKRAGYGQTIKYLVPEAVENYISRKGLYE